MVLEIWMISQQQYFFTNYKWINYDLVDWHHSSTWDFQHRMGGTLVGIALGYCLWHLSIYHSTIFFFSHTCNTWSPRSSHLTSPSFSVSFFLICLLLNLLLNTFHKRIMIKGNVHIKYQFLHIPREGPGYQTIAWVKSNWSRQSACYQAIILGLQRFLFKVSVAMTRTQSMYSFCLLSHWLWVTHKTLFYPNSTF